MKPVVGWISSNDFEGKNRERKLEQLKKYDGIIIPGGFGSRGVEGKINVIEYARKNRIPFLGLCYGMQLMLIEFARNVCGFKEANSTEINPDTEYPVVDLMPGQKQAMKEGRYGATMRLGAYPAILKPRTIAEQAYKKTRISERHRHRYEVNPKYISAFEEKGLVFSGASPDGKLMEIAELPKKKHPFFVASQFHPEFKSRPLDPHPLFLEFIRVSNKKRVKE